MVPAGIRVTVEEIIFDDDEPNNNINSNSNSNNNNNIEENSDLVKELNLYFIRNTDHIHSEVEKTLNE